MSDIIHFDDWIRTQPRGTKTRIFQRYGVSFTVQAQAERREPIDSHKVAKRLSQATGGVVSVLALCEPEGLDNGEN